MLEHQLILRGTLRGRDLTESPPSCGHSGFAATTWVDDAGGSSWCRCCSGRGQHLMAVQPGDAWASSIFGEREVFELI